MPVFLIIIAVVIFISLKGMLFPEPRNEAGWEPKGITQDQALDVASYALALGKVRGCGEIDILSSDVSGNIEVECFSGTVRSKHTITNKNGLFVDGKMVER